MNRNRIESQLAGDPSEMLRAAFNNFVDAGLEAMVSWLKQTSARTVVVEVVEHDPVAEAAALLDVDRLAQAHEIRAAFRACVKAAMAGGDFHDQTGDVTDARARQLIAAKNLLIDRTRNAAVSNV